MASRESVNPGQAEGAGFVTTHWSVVLEAGHDSSPDARQALEKLCHSYWYPLYAWVRRNGYSPHDAQDLTQEFFARFLARNYVSLADRSRGKFRTFLLTSLQHFLVNEWTKARTVKRGGFQRVISWDEQEAEKRYLAEPTDPLAPDTIFEKRWAVNLLESALAQLRDELGAAGKRHLFESLKQYLWGEKSEISYGEIGKELNMSEGAVKIAVHRLRHRYRELLRTEVAQTVATDEEVDEELQYLIKVIRG